MGQLKCKNLQWTNSLISNGTQGEIVSIACKPSIARGRFGKRDMTHQPYSDILIHLLQNNVEMKHKWIEIRKYILSHLWMEESSWRRTAPLVRLYVFFNHFWWSIPSELPSPQDRLALSSTQKVGPPLVCPDSFQVESIVSPSGRCSSTGTNGFQPAQQESGLSLYSYHRKSTS